MIVEKLILGDEIGFGAVVWCWPEAGKQTFLGVRELSSGGSLVFPALRGLYPELQLGAGAADHGVAGDAHRPKRLSRASLRWEGDCGAGQMGTGQLWDDAGTPAPGSHPSSGLGIKKVL